MQGSQDFAADACALVWQGHAAGRIVAGTGV